MSTTNRSNVSFYVSVFFLQKQYVDMYCISKLSVKLCFWKPQKVLAIRNSEIQKFDFYITSVCSCSRFIQ